MTAPRKEAAIPDASDKEIRYDKNEFIQGWRIDKWVDYIKRNPNCTLPSGVGAKLVQLIDQCSPNHQSPSTSGTPHPGSNAAS
jgi:hypothetical protein